MVDALLAFFLTAGQAHDLEGADALLPQMHATPCWPTRLSMPMSASSSPCSRQEKPPKSNRKVQRPYDKEMYKARYLMENFSFKLK
jgi:hypothetical protein